MQPTHSSRRVCGRSRYRRGFTLIELIVALTVISIATTILLQLYMTSTDLGYLAQHRELAATIAEDQVTQLVANPAGYQWDYANPDEAGLFRIRSTADDPRAGAKVSLPDVLIPNDNSYKHQEIVYDKFRWSAFGRLPSPASAFYEVVVDVQWKQKGKTEHVALSGAVPRSKVEPDWAEK